MAGLPVLAEWVVLAELAPVELALAEWVVLAEPVLVAEVPVLVAHPQGLEPVAHPQEQAVHPQEQLAALFLRNQHLTKWVLPLMRLLQAAQATAQPRRRQHVMQDLWQLQGSHEE